MNPIRRGGDDDFTFVDMEHDYLYLGTVRTGRMGRGKGYEDEGEE